MEALATCTLSAAPKALADALAAVKPAVASRSAIQALSGVRIVATGGKAHLSATDMEVAVRKPLDADVTGELDALVTHADLAKAAKLFAKRERVHFAATADGLTVTDGTRTINLRGLRAADYPAFPVVDGDPTLMATASELAVTLERAGRFASKDETRPILTGMAITVTDGAPRLWATDSYRLCDLALPALVELPATVNHPDGEPLVMPARGLLMAAKAMRKLDAEVTMTANAVWATIDFNGETWAMRRIVGQYPNFRQLVPDAHEVAVTIPLPELVGACELAVAFARKNAPMRLSVNGEVTVTGSTPDVADFREVLTGASYTGTVVDELVIGLNPEFALDIAKVHVAPDIELRLISALRPALFIDGDDLYLQMPIRLNV